MNIERIKCWFGFHNYEIVDQTWVVTRLKCKRCGSIRLDSDHIWKVED